MFRLIRLAAASAVGSVRSVWWPLIRASRHNSTTHCDRRRERWTPSCCLRAGRHSAQISI